MLLTDAHIRNAKPTAKAFKLSDGGGMHLIVTPANARYWRMDLSVRRTLAMGVYPTVSLATARASRDEARALLARNIDPVTAKKASKRAAELAHENTFELIAREWLGKQRRRLHQIQCAAPRATSLRWGHPSASYSAPHSPQRRCLTLCQRTISACTTRNIRSKFA
jgi:Arm DNA-binding domain